MKRLLVTLAAAAALPSALLADSRYSVFKLSDDPHTIRTSEGKGTLQAEYMVLEPSTRRVVAAVVTGGSVGERYVIIPFRAARFEGSREIVLTDIPKDRLEDAPEVERGRLNGSAVLEASLIDNSYTHFGIEREGASAGGSTSKRDEDGNRGGKNGSRKSSRTAASTESEPEGEDGGSHGKRSASVSKKSGAGGD